MNRVNNESRKRYKKLTDPEILVKITEQMDIYSIPFVTPLKVNTSELTADDSARFIVKQLGLTR